ncbi:MAG: spondin domain-containing protein [Candidatus Marinimicrobia bacterium]|nr:spondin domain-containing protein [Candidatus Neomarinimicrobiota bacterium]
MNQYLLACQAVSILVLISCEDPVQDEMDVTAEYQLTFKSTWSSMTHPFDFPARPHFSGLIGASHNAQFTVWEEGQLASVGIKDMAEKGQKTSLINEIDSLIQIGEANEILSGDGIPTSPGNVTLTFQMNQEFPLVSIVSMLAPSPDWFVGVSSLDLAADGMWKDSLTIDLYAYDAGTDSGEDYASDNLVTNPPENISMIEVSPFKVDDTIPSIGTFTFIRTD